MSEILVGVLMGAGTLLMMVAGIGVVRMPDALCRGHAVAKAVSLGIALILMGLWAHLGAKTDGLKLLLAIVFQLLTIPVASHLLARAVYQSGEPGRVAKPRSRRRSPGIRPGDAITEEGKPTRTSKGGSIAGADGPRA